MDRDDLTDLERSLLEYLEIQPLRAYPESFVTVASSLETTVAELARARDTLVLHNYAHKSETEGDSFVWQITELGRSVSEGRSPTDACRAKKPWWMFW
jgi:hypothetical protein